MGFKRNRYQNAIAVKQVPLLAVMYWIAYPLALGARRFGVTPNQLTFLSFISGLAASVLIALGNILLFVLLWAISFFLDFADGTLARMTGKVSDSQIDFDHLADLVKLSFIFVGFGFLFSSDAIWGLSAASGCLFLTYSYIHQAVGAAAKKVPNERRGAPATQQDQGSNEVQSPSKDLKPVENQTVGSPRRLFRAMKSALLSIHAHTFLVFFIMPFSIHLTFVVLLYLTALFLYGCFQQLSMFVKTSSSVG